MHQPPLPTPKKAISWVPTVYFAMGLPMVMISEVSLLLFKDLGIPNSRIAFWTALLIIPWSLKPLWSPVMELVGTKKQYVVVSELISALMLGLICYALGMSDFFAISVSLLGVMAISGSVHDIAGDGTYMAYLSDKEQKQYIGWQGAFYNLAKILARGGLVALVGVLQRSYGVLAAWRYVMLIAGALLLAVGIYHLMMLPGSMKSRRAEGTGDSRRSFAESMEEVKEVFVSFFRKKHIWYYLLFILLYRFTEGLSIRIAPLFLKAERAAGGLELTNEQFGLIFGTAGTAAFVLGSILSGYFISHYGLKRTLFSLALIFNLPFIVYFLLAHFMPTELWYTAIGVVAEFFGYGFGFVGLNLFMMQQIAPGKHQMAHYAIGTSLMNLSIVLPGMISGYLSEALGYRMFFLVALFVAIPGLICTYFVPFAHDDSNTLKTTQE